jgi:spore maturation protein CgeB
MTEKTAIAAPRRRRVLYVTGLAPFGTTTYRLAAMQRIGQEVQAFNWAPYAPKSSLLNFLRNRYPVGPLVSRVNRDLLKAVHEFHPEVVWFDKPLYFTPDTIRAIQKTGARVVFYVQDGPFGPRKDGYWRQFYRVFRMADLHCLVREADVARYREWGLPWIKTMFSFDPAMHFAPHAGWSDADRDRDLSYIGHPHEERPQFLLALAEQHGLPLSIDGNGWQHVFNAEQLAKYVRHGHLLGNAYREHIWKSKVNLSFVTHDNEDDIAHKSVEIAACAGFLLALRTPGHTALLEEDREAVFFSSVEECADKARFYLERPDLRDAIGLRARERAVRSGYDNDSQLIRILNRLDGKDEE